MSPLACFTLLALACLALCVGPTAEAAAREERSRVVVHTDISNEPDDEESLVRFLVYANEYDVEGLTATTSTWLKDKTREDLIRRQLDAYGQVRDNLLKHAPGFPSKEQLLAVTNTGQPGYGMAAVGDGKSSPGSQHLIRVVDRRDRRPVWVSIWGGSNTLAQALWDVKATRTPEQVRWFVRKLRVYAISDQDDTGQWLRTTFPELFYIVSPSDQRSKDYARATWSGISGDRQYKNGPMHQFHLVDNPWLEEHVIKNHGPLGALYPRLAYIMEGDTPAFLGLVNNGLGWHVNPGYGGWGGRYALFQFPGETRPIWTNSPDSRDTVTAHNGNTETSDQATIWRWREHFQHDFAARMDWCVADSFEKANHNPVAVLNGDRSKKVLEVSARSGQTLTFSAEGTRDPDGQPVQANWWIYREAGSYRGDVALSATTGMNTRLVAPTVSQPETVHLILQVEEAGTPRLFAYRRAVVKIRPR